MKKHRSKTTSKLAAALLLALGLCGCATEPIAPPPPPDPCETEAKQFNPPPPGWAGLYVYRGYNMGGNLPWKCFVDGHHAGSIRGGEFLYRLVKPGLHDLSGDGTPPYPIEFKEGENVFVAGVAKRNLDLYGNYPDSMRRVFPDEGMQWVSFRKLAAAPVNPEADLETADRRDGAGSIPPPCGSEQTPFATIGNEDRNAHEGVLQ